MNWDDYHAHPDQLNFFKYLQQSSGCGNHNGVTCLTNPPLNPRAILCTDPRQYVLPKVNESVVVEPLWEHHRPQWEDGLPGGADGGGGDGGRVVVGGGRGDENDSLDPDLFIFHEGRVGSTLAANMFGSSSENLVRASAVA